MSEQNTPPAAPSAPPADDKKFSQADLDRIVDDRLRRQRAQFQDYDQIKTELDQLKSQNATELEKAVAKAKDEGRAEVQTEANARLVQAEARALAAEAKFRNPQLAVSTLDLSAVKVNADGSVDADAIKALLATRAESDPYLIDNGQATPAPASQVGIGNTGTGSAPDPGPGKARLINAYSSTAPTNT